MATRFQNQTLRFFLTTPQGKTYTITFMTGFLLLVMIFIALLPAASSIVAQIAENQQRQAAISEINQKLTDLRALTANEQANRAISVALDEMIPNGFDQATVLEELLAISRQSGVNLTTYRALESKEFNPETLRNVGALGSKLGLINVTLVLEGGRDQLEGVVSALETSYRPYNLRTVSLNLITEQSEVFVAGTAFRMTLSLETYFWKIPSTT